jgi:hypothetical protein
MDIFRYPNPYSFFMDFPIVKLPFHSLLSFYHFLLSLSLSLSFFLSSRLRYFHECEVSDFRGVSFARKIPIIWTTVQLRAVKLSRIKYVIESLSVRMSFSESLAASLNSSENPGYAMESVK